MDQVLDIELAFRWAIREELPKTRRALALGPKLASSSLAQLSKYGRRIDGLRHREPFIAEGPHPDAETLVQAARELPSRTTPGHVDPSLSEDLAGFGIDIERYVQEAWNIVDRTVVKYALLADRPTCIDRPSPAPVRLARGHVAVMRRVVRRGKDAFGRDYIDAYHEPVRASRGRCYKKGAFCPLEWSPSPEWVLRDRAEYVTWWEALRYLAQELTGALSELVLLPPSAPPRPWLDQPPGMLVTEPAIRVHVVQPVVASARLP